MESTLASIIYLDQVQNYQTNSGTEYISLILHRNQYDIILIDNSK